MPAQSFRETELFRMHELVIRLDRAAQLMLEPLGVTFNDFLLLLAVGGNPTSSQQEVARFIGVGKASVSLRVRVLAEKGLVAQSLNPQNRRESHVVLTDDGRRVYLEAARILTERAEPIFDSLGSGRERFRAELGALLQSLQSHMSDSGQATE